MFLPRLEPAVSGRLPPRDKDTYWRKALEPMFPHFAGRALARPRWVIAASVTMMLAICGVASAAVFGGPFGIGISGINPFGDSHVGEEVNGRLLLPDDQWISPIGPRVDFSDQGGVGGMHRPGGTRCA